MDLLDRLVETTRETLASGYYEAPPKGRRAPPLAAAIKAKPRAILAEVKPASPTKGAMRAPEDAIELAATLAAAGARGLSILTEPTQFRGSLATLSAASELGVPTLMKDFVISERQLSAAHACGASAVLVIVTLFVRGYGEQPLAEFVKRAHNQGLGVLAEAVSASEFQMAQAAGADLVGINNRDLRTMDVDLGRTPKILSQVAKDRPVVGMSGVESRKDADLLFDAGCDAVLVGTSLMKASDPAAKLKEILG